MARSKRTKDRATARLAALTGATLAAGVLAACSYGSHAASRPESRHPAALAAGSLRASGGHSALTTYFYDNARDGEGPSTPSLRRLSRAWSNASVSGAVYAEPLIYSGEVLVATESDLLYALSVKSGKVAWKVRVGRPVESPSVSSAPGLRGCGDVYPLGVTGTPVIDTATGVLYLAAEEQRPGTSSWQGISHRLVAVSLRSHKVLWQKGIDPPGAGDGSGHSYIVAAEQQRSALTLANGRVYVEFGGLYGDCSAYHGYVVSRAASGKGGLVVYKTPSPREDAIWATSGAAVGRSGNLFVATGNGGNGPGQRFDYGNSVVKLSAGLEPRGVFAPASWAYLSQSDLDLGSDGPTLLPGGGYVFQSGKAGFARGDGGSPESWGYLLRTGRLGGVGHPAFRGQVCPDAGWVFGANSAARLRVGRLEHTIVYVPCPSGTVALELAGGGRARFRRLWEASKDSPNGPPILAGGLVWALSTGADGASGPADLLVGMSPLTGKVLVTEQVGQVEHFATPGAAEGLIVVGTTHGVEAFHR